MPSAQCLLQVPILPPLKYRISTTFSVESGHMLSKHPGLCRFPHGHSRLIEVVLTAERLDAMDMVCDFKTVKLALGDFLARYDHALAVNSDDPMLKNLEPVRQRVVVFEKTDPTTEVMAQRVFEHLEREIGAGKTYSDAGGQTYRFPVGTGLGVERVRVTETASTWAEFGR